MSERLKFLGRRQELELEKKSLGIKIEGLIENLRNNLDPLKKIEELRADAIVEEAAELASAKDRYMEILADLKRIQDILGR